MRIIWLTLAVVLASLGFSTAIHAADLPRDVASPLGKAVEKTRRVYTHATVIGSVRREWPQAHKAVEQGFVFRASGVRLRMDLTTLSDSGTGARVGGTDMYMATGIGSLVTIRAPGQTVFGNARELKYGDTKTKIQDSCRLNEVYTFASYATVLEFLRQPGVSAVQVKNSTVDGRPMVRVEFREVTGRSDNPKAWKSYFVFSPTEGWAIREYARSTGAGDKEITYRGKLTYAGVREGVPIVDEIQHTELHGRQHKVVLRETVVVSQFKPGEPDEEFFTAFDF